VKSSSNAKPITTIQQDIDNKCNLLKFPLVYKSISMTKADLYDLSTNTLRLNDEKMNYIGSLITDLYSPSSIYFSTQFYTLLVVKQIYNFEKVKNWHENRDFKVADKLIIPIHLKFEFHWILVVVDLKLKEIIYYDSAFNEKNLKESQIIIDNIKKYTVDKLFYSQPENSKGKRVIKSEFKNRFESYKIIYPNDAAKQNLQEDSINCGVYVL